MKLTELFTNIADAIRSKTGKTDKIIAENFANEIDSIKSMSNTNDATATAEDILEGKTAYVKEEKLIGTMKDTINEYFFTSIASGSSYYNPAWQKNIKKIPPFEYSGDTSYMFYNFKGEEIDLRKIDFSKTTNMKGMFNNAEKIKKIDFLNNKIYIKMSDGIDEMFYYCKALVDLNLGKINAEKVSRIDNLFSSCNSLKNINGSIYNLGKGYIQKTTNYSYYRLNLSYAKELTHDSLMNVINGLYDLNLTYDVANGGTLYAQTLNIGSTNKAKLTEEEIAIATEKRMECSIKQAIKQAINKRIF